MCAEASCERRRGEACDALVLACGRAALWQRALQVLEECRRDGSRLAQAPRAPLGVGAGHGGTEFGRPATRRLQRWPGRPSGAGWNSCCGACGGRGRRRRSAMAPCWMAMPGRWWLGG